MIADPERRLALAYARAADRPMLTLLWVLDERLGAIVAATREEMLGQIRLAWWRDALSALENGAPAGEPLLGELAAAVQAGRVDAAMLGALAEGWMALLDGAPLDAETMARFAEGRGATLFGLVAGNAESPGVADAGAGWALADLARRTSEPAAATQAGALAEARLKAAPRRWPRELRPLAVMVALARTRGRHGAVRMARAIWAGIAGR